MWKQKRKEAPEADHTKELHEKIALLNEKLTKQKEEIELLHYEIRSIGYATSTEIDMRMAEIKLLAKEKRALTRFVYYLKKELSEDAIKIAESKAENIEQYKIDKKQDDDLLAEIEANKRLEEEKIRKAKEKILKREDKRNTEKIATQELIEEGVLFPDANKRPPIPRDIVNIIWNRDGGKCVYCSSTLNLHIDHIIPLSKGGATNIENLQVLCEKCNLAKSNIIG